MSLPHGDIDSKLEDFKRFRSPFFFGGNNPFGFVVSLHYLIICPLPIVLGIDFLLPRNEWQVRIPNTRIVCNSLKFATLHFRI
jgi:hypothetical protein